MASLTSPLGGPGTPPQRGGGPGRHTGETFSLSRMEWEVERGTGKPRASARHAPAFTCGHVSSASQQTGALARVVEARAPRAEPYTLTTEGNNGRLIQPPFGVTESGAGFHRGLSLSLFVERQDGADSHLLGEPNAVHDAHTQAPGIASMPEKVPGTNMLGVGCALGGWGRCRSHSASPSCPERKAGAGPAPQRGSFWNHDTARVSLKELRQNRWFPAGPARSLCFSPMTPKPAPVASRQAPLNTPAI